ncbi:MAG TPA: hypothetical protein VII06_43350 [Chloroflexota bacterium]|jgi:hypothetical protein
MQVSTIHRTILALTAVAAIALSSGGLPGTPSQPTSAHAAPEAHHHVQWTHVPVAYQYFYGPTYVYSYDWYYHRHIAHPWLYRIYSHEPIGVCVTEYYFYGGVYYCYVG